MDAAFLYYSANGGNAAVKHAHQSVAQHIIMTTETTVTTTITASLLM